MQAIARLMASFIFFLALQGGAYADDGWRFPTDKITLEQWQTYRAEVLALPGATSREQANQLIVQVDNENAFYIFTLPAHPAHPAVVRRQLVNVGNSMHIDRKGHYAGDLQAFEVWWHQFDAIDEEFKREGSKKKN